MTIQNARQTRQSRYTRQTRTLFIASAFLVSLMGAAEQTQSALAIEPAAWGANHVGKPMPAYEDGNTCLFCHRTSIGPGWQTNHHATTMRPFGDEPNSAQWKDKADGAELVVGRSERLRFLKPTGAYGTVAMLGAAWSAREKKWDGESKWDGASFGAKCIGCHASAIDSTAKTYQTPSLDCHTCHGIADPEHTKDGALMLLAPKATTAPEVEVSVCGSCHLRGGKSKSTGLPFANNFVPGDNLFKDFDVDLSEKRIQSESSLEAHILQNARDVAVLGQKSLTCGSCHSIHKESSKQHEKLKEQAFCFTCHIQGEAIKHVRPYERHSATCEY